MARLPTTTDVFNAIAEPQRRDIITLLASGEKSVNDIAEALDFKQPQTSKHLRVLKEVGLVSVRGAGKQRLYKLEAQELKPVYDWVQHFEQVWNGRFDRLAHYLDQLQKAEGQKTMRKLKLQVQMTVDGFIAGSNGEMDWMALDWGEDIGSYVTNLTVSVDCIVLGRKLAEGFIPHWAAVAADPNHPEVTSGQEFTNLPKVVFSQTLTESAWDNTVIAQDDLVTEITRLKQQEGKDIIAYGGGTFVSNLIKHGLIDEFHLFVNPAAIGNGMPIFQGLEQKQPLSLKHAIAFACGIVVLCYVPMRS